MISYAVFYFHSLSLFFLRKTSPNSYIRDDDTALYRDFHFVCRQVVRPRDLPSTIFLPCVPEPANRKGASLSLFLSFFYWRSALAKDEVFPEVGIAAGGGEPADWFIYWT